ncbi:MAG TPA: 23S rRNA (uracil(1939)-C(5))-methyltransferase RlmD [Bacteroidota bacterium]|nr:23S rRNA (uracil(1939)-C(5))-methyltransferase RlmD [Bacteroidota bacterium]
MKKGEEIVLEIQGLSGEGKTISRVDGMVFFVEKAVPGDTVRARLTKLKKNYAEAQTVEVLTPSKDRVVPRCAHFGVCGGCKWQNLSYPAQLESKRKIVVDAFEHIGGFANPDVLPTLGCENEYYYRNKMEFTFSRNRWLTAEEMGLPSAPEEGIALGFHVPRRYDKVLDLNECFLHSELSTEILKLVRSVSRRLKLSVYSTESHEGYLRHLMIRDGKRTGDFMVNLVTTTHDPEAMKIFTAELTKNFPQITTIVNNVTDRKSMVAFGDSEKVYFGPGFINEKIGEYTFRISANSFFQTNTLQTERLYATAKSMGQLQPTDVAYDLYSGTGTIAIYLSDSVERVIGIEVIGSAILDAELNARANRIANCYFLEGDLKDKLTKDSGWLSEHPAATVMYIDPPRSGMHPKVIQQILKLAPKRIVYIRCNPATQARDAQLLAQGGYALGSIQPVDMFPHTDHIEAVASFEKR